jgi:hypothetical protein
LVAPNLMVAKGEVVALAAIVASSQNKPSPNRLQGLQEQARGGEVRYWVDCCSGKGCADETHTQETQVGGGEEAEKGNDGGGVNPGSRQRR